MRRDRRMGGLLLGAAASLLLAVGISQPLSAQEALYRMGWVTPEVACHAGPSHTSEVTRLIALSGEAWGAEEWVRQTETNEAGEVWSLLHHRGCWVPGSSLAPTDGAGHLLEMADRLLSTAVTPLHHLLVAHNLFVHPRYRQQVEGSATLTQRRVELLESVVEAAQISMPATRRPVDRDPMLLAWIESFGDEIRYSKNRFGRGTWTVARGGMEPVAPSPLREEDPEDPTEAGELAIIAPGAACRERPSPGARGRSLPVDSHFSTVRADTSVAGETWVFVRSSACWVAAMHTAPGDTDAHVSMIVDRFLTSGEGWSLDGFLRVYNVLSSRNLGHADVVEASAILGLRRLQVLGEALDFLSPRSADALTLAWVGSLGHEAAVTDEGSRWTVGDSAYLNLHDKHRGDPFAEEIMWKFASESDAYNCEGEYACEVEQRVAIRLARYWGDYPRGRYVADAMERARALFAAGLETCNAARGPEPDSREANAWHWTYWGARGAEIAEDLVATLDGVSDADKSPLIQALSALEACAATLRSSRSGGSG